MYGWNGIVTFDHYNCFKNNFTTTLRRAKNIYFQRKFTECSNNSRDTWILGVASKQLRPRRKKGKENARRAAQKL